MVKTKRVYEKKANSDGHRILVDRIWPRGLRSEDAGVDEWLKELAPSHELRRWFGHEPEKWPEFWEKYRAELAAPEKKRLLERIARLAAAQDVTLLYGARETRYNNARVLEELINELINAQAAGQV